MAVAAQVTTQDPLQAFFDWENDSMVDVITETATTEKTAFVPVEKIKAYFSLDYHENLNQILRVVFGSPYPPIDPESILVEHTAVFCILLRIGKGRYIEHFAGYEELSDRRLPFDFSHAPAELSDIDQDPVLLQRFCDTQWTYCVPTFDKNMFNKRFGKQRILPITYKEPCGREGLAEKSVISVYGPYNEMHPAMVNNIDDAEFANNFVLKTYTTKEGESRYRQEASGFRSMRAADGIVIFYGSFIHGETFNILLENTNKGTLEDYYQTETPPGRSKDIVRFWKGLFELIKGLKVIHSVREGHYDIKPRSILVVDSSAGLQFKLASFGLNASESRVLQDAYSDTSERDTAAYDAPERYTRDNLDSIVGSHTKLTWEADIWSLGCIYSEAAVWIADGYKGLLDYRNERKAQLRRILFKGGDSFHDGVRVLDTVLENHTDVEDRLRRSDHITKDVLDTMVDEMLWEEDRPNAKALSRKAEIVLSRANKGLSLDNQDQVSARPGSRQGRSNLPPRPPIPKLPLPSLPQALPPRMSSIAERHHPLNVERWRSQVGTGLQSRSSQMSFSSSNLSSPIMSNQGLSTSGSTTDLQKDFTESISKWSPTDNNSQGLASPITPTTSTQGSVNVDYRHLPPSQQRIRTERSKPFNGLAGASSSYISNYTPSEISSSPPDLHAGASHFGNGIAKQQYGYRETKASNGSLMDVHPLYRAGSQAGNRISEATTYSIPIQDDTRADITNTSVKYSSPQPIPPKSSRRLTPPRAFTLFPAATLENNPHHALVPKSDLPTSLQPQSNQRREPSQQQPHETDHAPRFVPSLSDSISTVPAFSVSDFPPVPVIYLPLQECLNWKTLHKKAKKNKPPPPLSGAKMLERLCDREHTFILDDSTAMSAVWKDVKDVFEALSYIVKPMAPDGTELYFTNAYDSWRRKDAADLCKLVNSKKLVSPVSFSANAGIRGAAAQNTNIKHRLHIQLEDYKVRLQGLKVFAGPAANKRKERDKVKPASFYILTNGAWEPGSVQEAQTSIGDLAEFLDKNGMDEGQVGVNFISFAETAETRKHIEDVASHEYAVNIVNATPWQGNVLKMLLGSVNRYLDPGMTGPRSDNSNSGRESRSSGRNSISNGFESIRSGKATRKEVNVGVFKTKTNASSIVSELIG